MAWKWSIKSRDFDRGENNWQISAPSALPLDENWLEPNELSISDIEGLKSHWEAAFNNLLRQVLM